MRRKITPPFNSSAQTLSDYTLTLTKPDGNPQAQAEDFCARLSRWLQMNGEDAKGNTKLPETLAPTASGNARLGIHCTEEMLCRIERQFAGDVLSIAPPAEFQRGTVFPPQVDPWDVKYW